jgi:hypothetical protein
MADLPDTDTIARRFALLVEALAQRIGTPLDPGEGTVLLADERGVLKLAIEIAEGREALFAVAPFLPFPAEPARLGEVALQLLQVNADREVMREANVAADGVRQQFCLVREIALALEPVPFIEAVEGLVALAEQVRAHIEGRQPSTGVDPMAAMFQRV